MKATPRPVSAARLLTTLLLAVVLLGPVLAAPAAHADEELANQRPNIILVMTDDQGYGDLACHGHPYLRTPNLDELYTQSLRLTDFHVSPTCAPTRAALLSGLAPFKNGVTHTILERERMALSSTTLAQALQQANYTTGIFGKWHLGDEDAYQPDRRGFDEVFIHGGGGIGQRYIGSCADVPGNRYFDPVIRHNDTFVKTQGYCTDIFFQQALGWIKTQHENDTPFFAYIPTNAPHGPFVCPPRYREYYGQFSDHKNRPSFYGMIENIDDNMGLLMQKLDEWGLADNTLLIYMSDNGTALGDFSAGMKGKKNTLDEGGSRVPAFWRWPGKLAPGQDLDTLLRHIDYFPTLAAITGAPLPEGLDGRSFLPLLANPDAPWEDRYTFFHGGRWNKAGVEGNWGSGNTDPDADKYNRFAIRNQRFRLVGRDTLYDIQADPGQTTNVIDQHPDVAADMLAAYDAWWDEVRPLMINEDAPLLDYHPIPARFEQQKQDRGIPQWTPPEL